MILPEQRLIYANSVRGANLIVAWKFREDQPPLPILASGPYVGDDYTLVIPQPKTPQTNALELAMAMDAMESRAEDAGASAALRVVGTD